RFSRASASPGARATARANPSQAPCRSSAPSDADARLNLARLVLRLGDWEKAEALWRSIDADEAKPALFRAAAEMGEQAQARRLLEEMMAEPQLRPAALKAMTRTAKGQIPLSAPGS
ncbi:MAG: tetratricopeptide repeat protein, partial [Pseudomonadota bacterium]